MAEIVPVILSGGSGTRLWPLSREAFPKQLHRFNSDYTLLQETAQRVSSAPIVICNDQHRFIVAEQLREIGVEPRTIAIEPIGRNTAPAATMAALLLEQDQPDALMLIMPSDHVVTNPAAFSQAVEAAHALGLDQRLVTFGIVPEAPNTGYGYIRRGAPVGQGFTVDRFVEKPDLATAQHYVQSGEFLWNSGIFLFPVRLWLEQVAEFEPVMLERCRKALAAAARDITFLRFDTETFSAIPSQSIDYAVMEKTARAAVVPVDMGWSDIGSWNALWEHSDHDTDGNVMVGDVLAVDTQGCYLRSEKRLVAAIGIENLVVIDTGDAILIAPKTRDQDVKKVVEQLKQRNRPEAHQLAQVFRPWGWFQTTDEGDRFKVKHILVNPGAKLSLQKHWHRSEHWIVVTGTALVTSGDKTFVLRENESTFIPAGTTHRLENPGRVPLRMIEVQSGEYVGEDDIVRLDDVYGRTPQP